MTVHQLPAAVNSPAKSRYFLIRTRRGEVIRVKAKNFFLSYEGLTYNFSDLEVEEINKRLGQGKAEGISVYSIFSKIVESIEEEDRAELVSPPPKAKPARAPRKKATTAKK